MSTQPKSATEHQAAQMRRLNGVRSVEEAEAEAEAEPKRRPQRSGEARSSLSRTRRTSESRPGTATERQAAQVRRMAGLDEAETEGDES